MKGNPSTSHMFIVHPFSGRTLANLFSTHPKTEERIKRLEAMNHKEDEWFIELKRRNDVESSNSIGKNEGQYNREKNVRMIQKKENNVASRNTKNETIAFYNLENFFDTKDDKGKDDAEYLPNSDKNWNLERYWTKVNHIADAISNIEPTRVPLIIGLAEVENKTVLNDLVESEKIENALSYIHFESDDRRGIDVALLYSKNKFTPLLEKQIKVEVPNEPYFVTRDILYVKGKLETGEKLHVFVNHWPSRREGPQKSQPRRLAAAFALREEVLKIQERNENAKIVIMGDFNDFPINQSLSKILKGKKHRALKKDEFYNLAYLPYTNNRGTHHSRHGWSMFDQILISRSLILGDGLITEDTSCAILEDKSIMFYDKRFEMYRPNRTYRGNTYHGGYSDHLPIYFKAKFKN
jgi:endonuclease/exonuclease/phosphatase family metal-dependent hydrolase